jgi:hypothetical protein
MQKPPKIAALPPGAQCHLDGTIPDGAAARKSRRKKLFPATVPADGSQKSAIYGLTGFAQSWFVMKKPFPAISL